MVRCSQRRRCPTRRYRACISAWYGVSATSVDATHGADFYQNEGIVLGNDVNLRTLLGLLKMFAEEVAGAEEVKYVPGISRSPNPSIEVHISIRCSVVRTRWERDFRPRHQGLGVDVPCWRGTGNRRWRSCTSV
jgi:hypothetical protein